MNHLTLPEIKDFNGLSDKSYLTFSEKCFNDVYAGVFL
jgi:hypothetical protein